MFKSKLKPSVLLTSLLLASCGGSDKNETPEPVVQEISVTAIDGYLRNARAYYDLNGNGSFEPGEPNTLTGEGGVAVVSVTDQDLDLSTVTINIGAIEGTVDETTIDSENPDGVALTSDQYFELRTLPGAGVASPLTTYAAIHAELSGDLDASKALVAKQFNVDVDALASDFIANDNKATAVVAELIIKTRILPGFIEEAKDDTELKLQLSLIHSLSSLANEMSADVLAISKESLETVALNGKTHLSNLRLDVESELSELSYDELNLIAGVISAAEMENALNVEMTTDESEAAQILLQNQYAVGAGIATLAESLKENLSVISATTVFDLTLQLMNHAAEQAQERHDVPLTAEQYQELNLFVLNVVGMDVIASVESEQTSDAIFDELSSGLTTVLAGVSEMLGSDINDLDGDGILNIEDNDIDGDGVVNEDDAFVYDKNESVDVDGDGIGDNQDPLVGEGLEISFASQSQKIEGQQTLAIAQGDILIPSKNGLYVYPSATVGDSSSSYDVLFQEEFSDLDVGIFFHAETLPNGNVLMFGKATTSEDENVSFSLLIEKNESNWEIVQIQTNLMLEEIVGQENVENLDRFNFEIFQNSPSGEYIYALVTDYFSSFIVTYKVTDSKTLELLDIDDVSEAGFATYEKNLAISESGKFLYYAAADWRLDSTALATIRIDQATGKPGSMSLRHYNVESSMQVFSLADEKLGLLKQGQLMLMQADSNGYLEEISKQSIGEFKDYYAAVSLDKTNVSLIGIDENDKDTILTYQMSSNVFLKTGEQTIDSRAITGVWSANADTLYTMGMVSGELHAFTPSSGELNSQSFGLKFINERATMTAINGKVRTFSSNEILQDLQIVDNEVSYTDFTSSLQFEDANSYYFSNPQFDSAGNLFGRVRVFYDYPVTELGYNTLSYIGLWSFDEATSEVEHSTIIESSRQDIFHYQAWMVSDEYFVTIGRNYASNSQIVLSLYKYSSETSAVHINNIELGDYSIIGSDLLHTGLSSFRFDDQYFAIQDGELVADSSVDVETQKIIKLHNNKVVVSLNAETGLEIKTTAQSALTLDTKSEIETSKIVSLEKWDENGFITVDLINENQSEITVYSVDAEGNYTEIAKGTLKVGVSEEYVKVVPMPDLNQVWLMTFNDDKDLFILDVDISN